MFAWADLIEVETRYSVSGVQGSNGQKVGELLIGRGVDLTAVASQGSLF